MAEIKLTDIGSVTILEDRLVEVSIKHGIILNRDMMVRGYARIAELAQGPYALLIDRTHTDYSMNFDAIREGGNHPAIIAQAYLIPPYDTEKMLSVETIIDYPRKTATPTRVFVNRDNALEWLRKQRDRA